MPTIQKITTFLMFEGRASPRFGWVSDRLGASWQLTLIGD